MIIIFLKPERQSHKSIKVNLSIKCKERQVSSRKDILKSIDLSKLEHGGKTGNTIQAGKKKINELLKAKHGLA